MIDPDNPPSAQAAAREEERQRAADGAPLAPAANSFSDFIRFQEDGQLNAELTDALKKLNHEMSATAIEQGGKAKGKLTLTFGFDLEGRVFTITSKYKLDVPEAKRPKSIMWSTEDGRFTPQNPQQMQLFGIRDARGPGGGFRDA